MTTSTDVCLQLGDKTVLAGTAFFSLRRGRISTTFTYAPSYLAAKPAYALGPDLPLSGGGHHASGLPGIFADSAPDRWGRNLIKTRLAAQTQREVTEVDYLLGVSDVSRQGSLRFRGAGGAFLAHGGHVPKIVELPRLLRAADAVDRLDQSEHLTEIKELLDAGSATLGGARPKASVREQGGFLIAKFPRQADQWDVMGWEMTALDLAHAAGIDVPERRLLRVDGRSILVLKRFDRRGTSRIGYASLMTMLQATEGETADYLDFAELVSDIQTEVGPALEQLFRRIAFSVMIHNTDDHLRNHGFLRRGRAWELSPAFDVNPNPDTREGRATSLLGVRHTGDEIVALLGLADAFRLTPAKARGLLRDVLTATSTWKDTASRNGIPAAELRLMTDAFEGLRAEAASAAAVRP